jgi:hypothetical protein
MKRKTPAQLGALAKQLPDATPAKARRLTEQLVAGFFGEESLPDLVSRVFPDRRSAAKWMNTPCAILRGKIPARLAKTKAGRVEVKSFLVGVGNGNFQ